MTKPTTKKEQRERKIMFMFSYVKTDKMKEVVFPESPSKKPVLNRTYETYKDNWGVATLKAIETPQDNMKQEAYIRSKLKFLDREEKHQKLVDYEGEDQPKSGYDISTDVASYFVNSDESIDSKMETEDLVTEFVEVCRDNLIEYGLHTFALLQEMMFAIKNKNRKMAIEINEQFKAIGAEDMVLEVIRTPYVLETLADFYEAN